MKTLYTLIITCCLACPALRAQYTGRIFVEGAGNIRFIHEKPENEKKTEGFEHGLSLSRGKFVTENKARGFGVSYSMSFAKEGYFSGPEEVLNARGLRTAYLNVGRFWSAYKHISDKFGVFGRLTAGVGQQFNRRLMKTSNGGLALEYNKERVYGLSIGLSLGAGAYYKLSEKCWLTGEFGFSNPVALSYSFTKTTSYRGETALGSRKAQAFDYRFRPAIGVPAIGLGLTYFVR